ncbi:hypothetical protein Ddc_23690 [Ditylenchus destructor]|nr:hypothetical protein Ddc_23690 [Ditylenchus destructor]
MSLLVILSTLTAKTLKRLPDVWTKRPEMKAAIFVAELFSEWVPIIEYVYKMCTTDDKSKEKTSAVAKELAKHHKLAKTGTTSTTTVLGIVIAGGVKAIVEAMDEDEATEQKKCSIQSNRLELTDTFSLEGPDC